MNVEIIFGIPCNVPQILVPVEVVLMVVILLIVGPHAVSLVAPKCCGDPVRSHGP